MSFYSFAAANLTTPADHKRRPAVNKGQVTRTLILCVLFLAALTLIARRNDSADSFHSLSARAATPLPGCASLSDQCRAGDELASPAGDDTKVD